MVGKSTLHHSGSSKAEDSQTMEEGSYTFQESEQQVEDKDEDADTENSAMLKATKKPPRA